LGSNGAHKQRLCGIPLKKKKIEDQKILRRQYREGAVGMTKSTTQGTLENSAKDTKAAEKGMLCA